jgi:hypothetical protein
MYPIEFYTFGYSCESHVRVANVIVYGAQGIKIGQGQGEKGVQIVNVHG